MLARDAAAQKATAPVSLEQYLRASAVPKEVLDTFLDPNQLSWAKFDPELGYHLGNYFPRDGIDGSSTLSTVQQNRRTDGSSVRRPGVSYQHLRKQLYAVPPGERRGNLAGVSGRAPGRADPQLRHGWPWRLPGLPKDDTRGERPARR